jgi:hypothetical protein
MDTAMPVNPRSNTMKYGLALLVVILAGTASASATEPDIIVELGQDCPPGYRSRSFSYGFEQGHFVRTGRVCESLQGRN